MVEKKITYCGGKNWKNLGKIGREIKMDFFNKSRKKQTIFLQKNGSEENKIK